jgi:hypothetical protein
MAFLSLNMGDKTHSTGIALLARIVQALLHRQRRVAHGVPQIKTFKQKNSDKKAATS